ncbi:MAG TPA: response regulator transcription factor [Acidisarcina sp.]
MQCLLLIDDDVELCAMLTEYLQQEGFRVEVGHRGDTGLARALASGHDLVVLDLMLPGLNGLDVLRRIRETSRIPVLLLTARGSEVDRIVGLEIGADDYLSKPFNPRELLARIRAVLRRPMQEDLRSQAQPPIQRLVVGDIVLDAGTHTVKRDGKDVQLTAMEFALLRMLLESAGQIVSREQMVTTVLGRIFSPFDRSLDVHVSNLRKKLGDLAGGEERIKSIRSVGYLYGKPADPADDSADGAPGSLDDGLVDGPVEDGRARHPITGTGFQSGRR